jgi:hypothetical protein
VTYNDRFPAQTTPFPQDLRDIRRNDARRLCLFRVSALECAPLSPNAGAYLL